MKGKLTEIRGSFLCKGNIANTGQQWNLTFSER